MAEFDFVVVGGGTSGCMVARELSSIGTVLILEKGGKLDLSYSNKRMMVTYKSAEGKYDINVGETLGGSSAINGAVWITSPMEPFLCDMGLEGDVKSYWERLEQILNPQLITPSNVYPPNELLKDFNSNLVERFDIAQEEVLETSKCGVGLVKGLVNNGNRTGSYAVLPNTTNITIKLNSAVANLGVTCENSKYTVESVIVGDDRFIARKKVVLCCGAYQTPNLLLRSPLAKLNKNIGLVVKEHPMLHFTVFNEKFANANPAVYAAFVRSPWAEHKSLPDFQIQYGFNAENVFFFVAFLLESKAQGRLDASENFPLVSFDLLNREDLKRWEWFHGKLSGVFTHEVFSAIKHSLEKSFFLEDNLCLGQHPCATCTVGQDDSTGVVDRMLKMYHTTNVYICDASVLPDAGHANMQSFVYAMALHVAKGIKDEFTGL